MENPLSLFSKVFRTAIDAIPLTEAVTLEFCYDHVNEDSATFNQEELLALQNHQFQVIEIKETE